MIVRGFNPKEQQCFFIFQDGKIHTLSELRKGFLSISRDYLHAHSIARNSIRRLVRDGWIKKIATGTYQLTKSGKFRIKYDYDVTASYGSHPGRKRMTKKEKDAAKFLRRKKKSKAHKIINMMLENKRKAIKTQIKQEVMRKKAKEIRQRIAKQSAYDKALEIYWKIVDNYL